MDKRALFTALSLGLLASPALAQGPVTLTEAQMDRVTAGQVEVAVDPSQIGVSIAEIVDLVITLPTPPAEPAPE